jgi:hypothetical protein
MLDDAKAADPVRACLCDPDRLPGGGALPFKWSIIDSRTRDVVEASEAGHRTMEAAFMAAGPALRRWLGPSR